MTLGKCEPLATTLRYLLTDYAAFAKLMRFMEGHVHMTLCIMLVVSTLLMSSIGYILRASLWLQTWSYHRRLQVKWAVGFWSFWILSIYPFEILLPTYVIVENIDNTNDYELQLCQLWKHFLQSGQTPQPALGTPGTDECDVVRKCEVAVQYMWPCHRTLPSPLTILCLPQGHNSTDQWQIPSGKGHRIMKLRVICI